MSKQRTPKKAAAKTTVAKAPKKAVNKKPAKPTAKQAAGAGFISRNFRVSKTKVWLLIAALLIWIGMSVGGFEFITTWWTFRHNHGLALTNNAPVTNSKPLVSGTPVHIAIPEVNIDLNVIPGYYNKSDGSWTLSLNDAQWGTMTAKANNKAGDTYIYAHYRLNVFYTLPKIKPGNQAILTTDNGHTFVYQYISSTITTPEDTSILNYRGKPVLVLQTCTGLWYQYRQLFTFHLVEVDGRPAGINY